ncbi:MAG: hypothetical protein ACQEUN_13075 [Pseudomonadota bacterium]
MDKYNKRKLLTLGRLGASLPVGPGTLHLAYGIASMDLDKA